MSIRVNLQYTKALDLELIEKGIEVWIRRLAKENKQHLYLGILPVFLASLEGFTRSLPSYHINGS